MPTPSSSAPHSPRYGTTPATPRIVTGRNVTPYPASALRGHYRSQSLMSDTASPTSGAMTQTVTSPNSPFNPDTLVLRLRGHHDPNTSIDDTSSNNSSRSSFGSNSGEDVESGGSLSPATRRRRRITWAEDVIDNEGLGRKSSKVCCIYHKAREFGESSSEEDSSSSSDSDSDGSESLDDDGAARMSKAGNKRSHHNHGKSCSHGHGHGHGKDAKKRPTPNAYEKMPRYAGSRQVDMKS